MDEQILMWLLEDKEPSIRYKTLTQLLDRSCDAQDVLAAKASVANCKNVNRIFSRANADGLFPHKPGYYGNWTTIKYLTILAELGLKSDDARIWPVIDWILTPGNDKCEHFVQKEFPNAYILDDANMGSCGQVRFLSTLVRLGYLDDMRVRRLIDVFVDKVRFDGGYLCKWKKSPHSGQEPKSCYAATVPALLLYAELPEGYRTGKAYDALIAYFVSRDMIFSKVEPGLLIADTRMAFFDGELSQILTIAYAMSKLGLGQIDQMRRVREILNGKPCVDGRYVLEATNSKKAILMDKPGMPSKWITFYMMLMHKYDTQMSHYV